MPLSAGENSDGETDGDVPTNELHAIGARAPKRELVVMSEK
jgi:hypothetical protein